MSDVTGMERLREFVAGVRPFIAACGVTRTAYDREHTEVFGARLRDFLSEIADQIASDHAVDCHRMGLDHGAVSRVITDMERHVSGVEGMDDSPVARWARELRSALGGRDEGAAERPTVPVDDLWEARRERDLYRECLDVVRSAVVGEEVTVRGVETDGELLAIVRRVAERAARARDACEGWPRLEGGAPLRLGDEAIVGGVGVVEVLSVEVGTGGFDLRGRLDGEEMGGRLHFPAGTVLRSPSEDSWGRVLRDAAAGGMTEGELERRARTLAGRRADG